MAQVALLRTDDRPIALREITSELLSMDEPRRRLAAMMSGLDIQYDLGDGHSLLGRRMPDLDLVTADGPLRVSTLLHDARPVLLNLGEPGGFDITPWADRVQVIDAEFASTWELPVLGQIAAPAAALIRPDGYIAWLGDGTDTGLREALTTWFGSPRRNAMLVLTESQMEETSTRPRDSPGGDSWNLPMLRPSILLAGVNHVMTRFDHGVPAAANLSANMCQACRGEAWSVTSPGQPWVRGWPGSAVKLMTRPSRTSDRGAQVSGQSCGHAPPMVRAVLFSMPITVSLCPCSKQVGGSSS